MQTPNELMPDGLQMDLLWNNATVTSVFPKQTIALDLSNYKYLLIKFRQSVSDGQTSISVVFVDGIESALSLGANRNILRGVKASNDEVTFTSGYYIQTYGTYTENNDYCIPFTIYGVK